MITEAVEIGIAVIKKGRKKAGIQGHAVEVLHRRKKESMDTIDTTTSKAKFILRKNYLLKFPF